MISDPWIDRSRPARVYKTHEGERQIQRERRAELRAAGLCICGPSVGTVSRSGRVHGPPYKGGRCEQCWIVKSGHDERVSRDTRARNT